MNRSRILSILFFGTTVSLLGADQEYSALDALHKGADYFNNRYDYQSAITWFLRASNLYEQEAPTSDAQTGKVQAWIGLAMAYHNVGNFVARDQYMEHVQQLLHIPDDITAYVDKAQYTQVVSDYCVVDGYRSYIGYEQAHKAGNSIDKQELYLHKAIASFHKALEIAQVLQLTTETSAHALHGLGTMFEFLSLCQERRGNMDAARAYAQQSVDGFEQALTQRKRSLGIMHPHVARSLHKLARSYIRLGNLYSEMQQELYTRADRYYQEALAIFTENNIPVDQAKYKELRQEYDAFKGYYVFDVNREFLK